MQEKLINSLLENSELKQKHIYIASFITKILREVYVDQ